MVHRARRLFTFNGRFVLNITDREQKDLYKKCSMMLDSGATDSFVSELFVKDNGICTEDVPPDKRIDVRLADGTRYQTTKQVKRTIHIGKTYTMEWTFLVLPLQGYETILGLDWLEFHNPHIDWHKKTVKLSYLSKTHKLYSTYDDPDYY